MQVGIQMLKRYEPELNFFASFVRHNTANFYTTNWECTDNRYNSKCITALERPVAKIKANNTSRRFMFKADIARNLENTLFFCVGAKVLLTSNISTNTGLSNGSTGIFKDIIYALGVKAPDMFIYFWIDFGAAHSGLSFFSYKPERSG